MGGTWGSAPPASHAHPLIPIPQLASPQTFSDVKAAVSRSPGTEASAQECFLPALRGSVLWSLPPPNTESPPSSARPALCQSRAARAREAGGRAARQPGHKVCLHTGPHSSSTCWYKAHFSSLAVPGPWASLAKPSRLPLPLQAPPRQAPQLPATLPAQLSAFSGLSDSWLLIAALSSLYRQGQCPHPATVSWRQCEGQGCVHFFLNHRACSEA